MGTPPSEAPALASERAAWKPESDCDIFVLWKGWRRGREGIKNGTWVLGMGSRKSREEG